MELLHKTPFKAIELSLSRRTATLTTHRKQKTVAVALANIMGTTRGELVTRM